MYTEKTTPIPPPTLSFGEISAVLKGHSTHYKGRSQAECVIDIDLGEYLRDKCREVESEYEVIYRNYAEVGAKQKEPELSGYIFKEAHCKQWLKETDAKLRELKALEEELSYNVAILEMYREAAYEGLRAGGSEPEEPEGGVA